jgi:hypothetical protein
MANDPTEEVIKREVREAARILREDGHATRLSAIETKLNKHFPDEPDKPEDGNPNGPKTPDKKDPATSSEERRRGIWWGEAISDE